MDERECRECKRVLAATEFDMKKGTQERKGVCRSCCRAIGKAVSAKNRELRELGTPQAVSGRNYQGRQLWLEALGFKTYREYLGSDLWKDIRRRVYAAKGSACHLCGNPATELHHNRYHLNDLKGRKLKYINPVCRACHEGIEFDEGGRKGTVRQAANKFRRRRRERRAGR